jgi:hypothetical protein
MSDSHWIIAAGALAILAAGILCGFGKIDGGSFALTCGAVFGSSALAGFRK